MRQAHGGGPPGGGGWDIGEELHGASSGWPDSLGETSAHLDGYRVDLVDRRCGAARTCSLSGAPRDQVQGDQQGDVVVVDWGVAVIHAADVRDAERKSGDGECDVVMQKHAVDGTTVDARTAHLPEG